MIQVISTILAFCIVLRYFKLKQNATKKYGDSVTFQIIDREYNKWYKKRGNGVVINKNTASMFEVDKVIWILKKNLEGQGINKEQLINYLEFLENYSSKKYGLKEMALPVLSYLGIENLLKNISSNFFIKNSFLDSK
ncbi:hypothetical protein [Streptococcus himalayensis]|uniref:Uncharacterized protein n=1 Tax=Streptococcus himalayensis TaxID=1888195 RepID=A0A917A8M3_9STRE|nr:hypothetical protein [Streptococcus himalayensis]GGE35178.1 hypothetical protein GCM10011510_15640 [Streptococcus himalayensis]